MNTKNALLVVVDGSDDDVSALARAAEFAKAFGARIDLFCCLYDSYLAAERLFNTTDLTPAKRQFLDAKGGEIERLAQPLRDAGHEVTTSVVWDTPVYEGIVRQVLATKPRLVIRGRHYHNALNRALFSNDDWNLIRTCPAPLLITRKRRHSHESPRIWAAVDPLHEHDKPAELDGEIIRHAQQLAIATGGNLNVIHAYDPALAIAIVAMGTLTPASPPVDAISAQMRDQHAQALAELAGQHSLRSDQVHNLAGTTHTVLPGIMIEREADVLVMGSVSRGLLKRALIGSTAERILDRVPCDLLVVKPRDFKTSVKEHSQHRIDPQQAA